MTNQKLKDDIYDALKTACMYAPDLFALIVEDANQYHVLSDLPQTENLEFLTESPWQSYVFSKLTTYILGALEDGDLHYATTTGDEFEIALSTDTDYSISITTKRIHYSIKRFFGQFDEDSNTLSEDELAFEDVVAQTVDRNDLHETQQSTLRDYCKRLSHELDLVAHLSHLHTYLNELERAYNGKPIQCGRYPNGDQSKQKSTSRLPQ